MRRAFTREEFRDFLRVLGGKMENLIKGKKDIASKTGKEAIATSTC